MGSRESKTRHKHGFVPSDGCPPHCCAFIKRTRSMQRQRQGTGCHLLMRHFLQLRPETRQCLPWGSGALTILPPLPVIVYQQSQPSVVPRSFPEEGVKQDNELQTQKSKWSGRLRICLLLHQPHFIPMGEHPIPEIYRAPTPPPPIK